MAYWTILCDGSTRSSSHQSLPLCKPLRSFKTLCYHITIQRLLSFTLSSIKVTVLVSKSLIFQAYPQMLSHSCLNISRANLISSLWGSFFRGFLSEDRHALLVPLLLWGLYTYVENSSISDLNREFGLNLRQTRLTALFGVLVFAVAYCYELSAYRPSFHSEHFIS